MSKKNAIPVIDLFAGPGGLCEGFSSVFDETGARRFAVKVSVEMDPIAHRTLLLRAIFRKFPKGKVPDAYYDYVRGKLTREAFFSHPEIKDAAEQATREARCAELGVTPAEEVDAWIQTALSPRARDPRGRRPKEGLKGSANQAVGRHLGVAIVSDARVARSVSAARSCKVLAERAAWFLRRVEQQLPTA